MTISGGLADRPVGPPSPQPLGAEELRWRCPPVQPSEDLPPALDLFGQERPLQALKTGLEINAVGYHMFVSGLEGTGRAELVKRLLEQLRPSGNPGRDRVYLNNFTQPSRPRLLTLPQGKGPGFQRDMEQLVLRVQEELRASLGSRPHKMSRRLVSQNAEVRQRRIMDALARLSEGQGCALVQFENNGALAADIYVVHGDESMSPQELCGMVAEGRLTPAQRDELLARRDALVTRLEEVSERIRRDNQKLEGELCAMDRQAAGKVLQRQFGSFMERWPEVEVADYLAEVRAFIERDLDRWVLDGSQQAAHGQSHLLDLGVHVVHTSSEGVERQVIVESNPTYANLFGAIEPLRETAPGLSMIQSGALLRADGGYLVLSAAAVLSEPGVWSQLKRALKSRRIEIREYDPGSGTTTGALQPESIPLDTKVVMIGEPGLFDQLAHDDPEFLHVFKVHAEFDRTVPANDENRRRYADYLATLARDEGLRPFSPDAVAAMVELGARQAGRRDRLATCFEEIGDLGREAAAVCGRNGSESVQRQHVQGAWRERQRRLDLVREHVEKDMEAGYLMVRTDGRSVGQVNSLTVLDTGTFAFGKPCRITASTGVGARGRARLLNIEREAALSGPIHDKGVMILGGYLLDRYAQDGLLSLQATVCFEQNYGGVDGDSASSAELYALLSSLSKVPLRQGIGVTGSVNQKGEVQAVSGINEKIEGFYRLCRAQGMTGDQGVMIPAINVSDLMLDEDVVEAVACGEFSVWTVASIDEGLAVLTGMDPTELAGRVADTLDRFRQQAG